HLPADGRFGLLVEGDGLHQVVEALLGRLDDVLAGDELEEPGLVAGGGGGGQGGAPGGGGGGRPGRRGEGEGGGPGLLAAREGGGGGGRGGGAGGPGVFASSEGAAWVVGPVGRVGEGTGTVGWEVRGCPVPFQCLQRGTLIQGGKRGTRASAGRGRLVLRPIA